MEMRSNENLVKIEGQKTSNIPKYCFVIENIIWNHIFCSWINIDDDDDNQGWNWEESWRLLLFVKSNNNGTIWDRCRTTETTTDDQW